MVVVKENVFDVIRNNIKHYRKEKGMTQEELAEKMNVSFDYIRQIESEKSGKHLSIMNMAIAAEVLDIELYKFFVYEKYEDD